MKNRENQADGRVLEKFGSVDSTCCSEDRLAAALREIWEAMESGESLDRSVVLEKYPDIHDELISCLDSLDLVNHVAPQLADSQGTKITGRVQPLATLGDFRIVREIGRGGMGIVYEAEQLSLGRSVALKVLPFAAMLDKKQLERFKNEARTAATLSHPNIVPVHFVGTERSVHFYAMQLIEGQSLTEVISEMREERVDSGNGKQAPEESRQAAENEGSTQRVPHCAIDTAPQAAMSTQRSIDREAFYRNVSSLGIQAAEALAHAHECGVLHRDIKPGNLLLDETGKLWVTDFGLARVEADSRMTVTGDLLGTLRYMAPEQALAKRVVVDHRADIYSLGVTLYELLTLQPAFDGDDRQELLKNIAFEQPRPLRKIDSAVSVDLQTIILKAIEKNPEDRYHSAAELSEDLLRFLDNRPILAKPPGVVDQARKWSRRNSGAVMAAAVMLLLTVVLLSATSALILRSNTLVARERNAAQTARQNERNQRIEAERLKTIAEENFRRARAAVDGFLTQVSDNQLLDVPSLQPLRKDLLELALKYYEEFVAERSGDESLQGDLASAYYRVGKITSEIGRKEDALKAHLNALVIREELAKQHPESREIQMELAEDYRAAGKLLHVLGKMDEALTNLREAVAISTNLINHESPDTECELVLAKSYHTMGNVHRSLGHYAESIDCLEAAIELLEALPTDASSNEAHRYLLAETLDSLTAVYVNTGRNESGLPSVTKSVEIMEELVAANPQSLSYRIALARFLSNRAVLERGAEARRSIERAVEIAERLARENPQVTSYQESLAHYLKNLSGTQSVEEKMETLKRTSIVLQELVDKHPNVSRYRQALAQSHARIAYATNSDPDFDEAIRSALEVAADLVARNSDVPDYRAELGSIYELLGGRKRTNYKVAADAFSKAIDIRRTLVEQFPRNDQYRRDLGYSYGVLGEVRESDGQTDAAIELYLDAVDVMQTYMERHPDNMDDRRLHFSLLRRLADEELPLGSRKAEVETAFQRSLKIVESFFGDEPKVMDTGAAWLAAYYFQFTKLQKKIGKRDSAAEYLSMAIEAQKAVVNNAPDDRKRLSPLLQALKELVLFFKEIDCHEEMVDQYRETLNEVAERYKEFLLGEWWNRYVNNELRELRAEVVAALLESATQKEVHNFFDTQVVMWNAVRQNVEDETSCLIQLADLHSQFGNWLQDVDRDSEAKMELQRAIDLARNTVKLGPENETSWDAWEHVTISTYRLQNWAGAEEDANLAVELTDKPNLLICIAPLYLLAGQQAEYRALCQRLLDAPPNEPEDRQREIDSWTARMCGLDPEAAGDPRRLLRVAERCLGLDDDRPPHYLFAFGRACYRAGDYEQAVEWLDKAQNALTPDTPPTTEPLICLDLALAYHYWGRPDEARQWWEQATRVLYERGAEILGFHEGMEFSSMMEIEVLRHEAEQLMGRDDSEGQERAR